MNAVRRGAGAFTLIELLLVMVILVVLSSIVVVGFSQHRKKADIAKAKTDISNYETALGAFQVDCGRFPNNSEGLTALAINPGVSSWSGPYIKMVVPDPWRNSYVYEAPGTHFPDTYDLHSSGPDPQNDDDDIVNWRI